MVRIHQGAFFIFKTHIDNNCFHAVALRSNNHCISCDHLQNPKLNLENLSPARCFSEGREKQTKAEILQFTTDQGVRPPSPREVRSNQQSICLTSPRTEDERINITPEHNNRFREHQNKKMQNPYAQSIFKKPKTQTNSLGLQPPQSTNPHHQRRNTSAHYESIIQNQ